MSWRSWVTATVLVLGPEAVASAHPGLEEGTRRYEEADFAGALEALAAAEAAVDLSREDLLRLVELRALVHFAQGDPGALRRDLEILVSLDPDRHLDARAPPAVRDEIEGIRRRAARPIEVHVVVEPAGGGVRVRAEVVRDPADVVRSTRVGARVRGGRWLEGEREVLLPVGLPVDVDAWAVARGPGGAPIARQGSADRPVRHRLRVLSGPAPAEEDGAARGGRGAPVWPWIAVAGAVVTALGAVLFAVKSEPADTRLSPPHLGPPASGDDGG